MNTDPFSTNNKPALSATAQTDMLVFLPQPRSVDATEGVKWIGQAWHMLKQHFFKWILINIILFAIIIVILLIPFINLFRYHIMLFFTGGIIAICEHQRQTGHVRVGLLFGTFRRKLGAMLIAIIIESVCRLILLWLLLLLISLGDSTMSDFPMKIMQQFIQPDDNFQAILTSYPITVYFKITSIVGVVSLFGMAMFWFTPALIMNHHYEAGAAILTSLKAVIRNIFPGIVFFVVLGILLTISVIPLGLGALITLPLAYICHYTSYRSVFFSATHHNLPVPGKYNKIVQ